MHKFNHTHYLLSHCLSFSSFIFFLCLCVLAHSILFVRFVLTHKFMYIDISMCKFNINIYVETRRKFKRSFENAFVRLISKKKKKKRNACIVNRKWLSIAFRTPSE